MEGVKIVPTDATIQVWTPYNREFVEEIRTIPTRRWTGEYWEVSKEFEDEIRKLVKKYFPPLGERFFHLYILHSEGESTTPSVDGVGFVSFSRDYVRSYDRPGIEILFSNLTHGGSAKYPWWGGALVVTLHAREDPVVGGGTRWILKYKGKDPPSREIVHSAIEEARRLPVPPSRWGVPSLLESVEHA